MKLNDIEEFFDDFETSCEGMNRLYCANNREFCMAFDHFNCVIRDVSISFFLEMIRRFSK